MRRRRRNDPEEFFGMIITFAIIWAIYNAYKFIAWFYQEHPVLFYIIVLVLFAGGIALIAFIHNLREKKWLAIERIEDMHKLHWREFEQFIEFVLKKKGFRTKLGTGTKDGWVDIEASYEWRKYLIQCKKWQNYKISEPNIREFLWAISDFDSNAKWIYVTTSNLTVDAKAFAKRNDIEIWDKFSLEQYVREYTGKEEIKEISSGSERICDKCWGKLIERVAKHGDNKGNVFLGCEQYPKCKTVVNL